MLYPIVTSFNVKCILQVILRFSRKNVKTDCREQKIIHFLPFADFVVLSSML